MRETLTKPSRFLSMLVCCARARVGPKVPETFWSVLIKSRITGSSPARTIVPIGPTSTPYSFAKSANGVVARRSSVACGSRPDCAYMSIITSAIRFTDRVSVVLATLDNVRIALSARLRTPSVTARAGNNAPTPAPAKSGTMLSGCPGK